MSYEDVIRVADLKTRRSRFDRIRRDNGAADGTVMIVTDYFKPDLDELYGILPVAVAAPIARWAEAPLARRAADARPARAGPHPSWASCAVWGLGRLRFMRPSSLRFRHEWALIDRWQRAVLDTAALDLDLAAEVARTADVVKGYGDVRRRLFAAFERFLDQVLPGIVTGDRVEGRGFRPRRRDRPGRARSTCSRTSRATRTR